MQKINRFLLALLAFFFVGQTLLGQVASPPGYRHITGSGNGLDQNGSWSVTMNASMGRDGFIVSTLNGPSIADVVVFDNNLNQRVKFSSLVASSGIFSAIDSQRVVWVAVNSGGDIRMSRLTEQGAILSQSKFVGYTCSGLYADSIGRMFCIFSNGSGTGMMRFSGNGNLDFQKTTSFQPGGSIPWNKLNLFAIDQRFYMPITGNRILVMDLNGDVIRVINGVGEQFVPYPDNSFALLKIDGRNIEIYKYNDLGGFQWGRSIAAGPTILMSDTVVESVQGLVTPQDNELFLLYGLNANRMQTVSCGLSSLDETVNAALISMDGDFLGGRQWEQTLGLGPRIKNNFNLGMTSYGAPLTHFGEPYCTMGGIGPLWPSLELINPQTLIPNCSMNGLLRPIATLPNPNYTITFSSATSSAISIPQLSDSVNFFLYPFSSGGGSIVCDKPCIEMASAQAIGGGVVQFEENMHGFFSFQYDFGDGTFGTTVDPQHTYTASGNYNVTLIATNECGSDTMTVITSPCINASIVGIDTVIFGTLTAFSAVASLPADSIDWLIDGVFAGNGSSLNYTPVTVGVYQIGMVYHNGPCHDTLSHSLTVFDSIPVANFSAAVSGPVVTLIDSSQNATSQSWDFGDGTTATGPTTSHTYSTSGTYTICQYVFTGTLVDTFCVALSIVTGNNAFWRTNYSHLGGNTEALGQVTDPLGNTFVVGSASVGSFMLMVDSVGGVVWTKTLPSASYKLQDVTLKADGNFLVVGGAENAGVWDGLIMEVSPSGNISNSTKIATTIDTHFDNVNPARYGGYCITGNSPTQFFGCFLKLDGNLQVEWAFETSAEMGGMYQAIDSTYWLVHDEGSSFGQMTAFGQLSMAGVLANTYLLQHNSQSTFSIRYRRIVSDMNCSGEIAVIGTNYVEDSQFIDASVGLAAIKFNTNNLSGTATGYSYYSFGSTNYPDYDFVPTDLSFRPDGNVLGTGFVHQTQNPTGGPGKEQVLLDLDFSNMNLTETIYGNGNTADSYTALSNSNTGAGLVAESVDGNLALRKFDNNSTCNLGAGAYAPVRAIDLTSSNVTISPLPITYTSLPSPIAWPVSPTLIAGAGTTVCAVPCSTSVSASFTSTVVGDTITLTSTSTPGADLNWIIPGGIPDNCNNGNSITFAPSVCGNVTVSLVASNGCDASTASQLLVLQGGMSSPSSAPSLMSDTAVCSPGPVTLTAPSGYDAYLWGNGAITNSTVVTAPSAVSILVGDTISGCYSIDTVNLSVGGSQVSIGADTTVCIGESVTFDAGAGFAIYAWSNSATTQTISVSAVGSYSVTVTEVGGCVSSDTVNLNNFAAASVNLGPDLTVCPGQSSTLDAGAGFSSYLWSNGSSTQTIAVSAAGAYAVTVTDTNGCAASDTLNLNHLAAAAPNLGPDLTVCPGQSSTLDAGAGFSSYLWSNGSSTQTIFVSTAGIYSVTVTNANGCATSDTLNLNNFAAANVNLGPNQTRCAGQSATFDAGPGFSSYVWSNGATSQTVTVTAAGFYLVTVTNSNGCSGISSASLTILPSPATFAGPDISVCPGLSGTLDAGPGFSSYLWSNGSSTQTISVSTAGAYTVTVTNSNGCAGADTVNLNNLAAAAPNLGPDVSVCPGQSTTLDAGSGFSSYLWSNGSSTQTITVATAGDYTVTVTNSNGCTASDTMNLNNFAAAAPNLGPDVSVCPGQSATLDAGSGFSSYLWSNGGTSQTVTVAAAGTYAVTVTTSNGCTGSDSVVIGSYPITPFSLGNDTSVVSGSTLVLNAPSGFSNYTWNTGASTASISVTGAGVFSVQATDANGCIVSDTIEVFLVPQPMITFVYNGMTVDFSGLPNGMASYYWTFGNGDTSTQQNPSYTYTVAGSYQVCLTITTAQGYSATTCVTVTVPGALAVVGGENYRFDVSPNPASDRLKVHVFTGSDDCLRFTLTNMLGQPVWSREIECAQEIDFEFDVQGISNGVYFLRLQGETIVDIRKLEILR